MKKSLIVLVVLGLVFSGCGNQQVEEGSQPEESVSIANPASENCEKVGGKSEIKDVMIDGEKFGQYGVCEFEEGRLCEEWALLYGECLEGGVKVTGYVTEAAKYCAITGGTYAVSGQSGETFEQGTCTGASGRECEVWDYYRGACSIK
ncbi:DUF333 domain-containing protein [Patescibacteria group bacterium]|nr:DUF333 domain-containing protein [Patescibacteria group bacterium]